MRFCLSRRDERYEFLTPDGPDDDLSECLDEAFAGYAGGWQARLHLLEGLLNQSLVGGEDWRDAILEDHDDARRRARLWGGAAAELTFAPDPNPNWKTWNVDRKHGPVDHYMMGLTTARSFFARLIANGIRERGSQNPFDRDDWHLAGDDEKWLYCVQRYGGKASYVYPHAGAHFLPMERRPYHRSLFNPAGISQRMATAMRNRLGDHVATNMIEVMKDDPAGRFDDIRNCTAAHWPDLGDTIYARNKGGDKEDYNKPVVIKHETLRNMYRRIDLDHAEDPLGRPSVAQLKAMWAEGDEDALKAFGIFQKTPSQGDGPPTYSSVHELLEKACIAEDVTVGRGSARRMATMRWARREKVDRLVLKAHHESKSAGELEKAEMDVRIEIGWNTNQIPNYGSHAVQLASVERKRAQHEVDLARQAAEARGEKIHDRPPISDAAREAASHAMRRPQA